MGKSEKETTKNYTIRISNNAIQNINDITGFIAYIQHQPLNAIKVGDMIFDTIDKIELNPLIFQICEEIPTKTNIYRRAICSSWTIIFKVKGSQILILGIIHSSRKPSKIRMLKKVK